MKKILLSLLLVLPLSIMAQQKSFMSFFDKYSGEEGFTTVALSAEMIGLMGSVSEAGDDDLAELLKNIEYIRIVVAENESEEFVKDIKSVIKDSEYNVITSINESGQKTSFYTIEKNKKTVEFLMVSYGKGEDNVVINIIGDVDVKQVSKLSQKMGN